MSELITKDIIEAFEENGAVLLKGIFKDHVQSAREAIEENKANPSWRERTYEPEDGSAPFFQDYVVWDKFDGYRSLVRDSAMSEIAASLMKSKTARIFHDHILVKEPGNSIKTPWHQDQPYYLVEGEQTVSFWVPLDPIPRDRTIEYVSGSHKWNKNFRPDRFDGTPLFAEDSSEVVPDIDANRDEMDVIGWAVEPGDAVAFSFKTLHGAPANSSDIRRRVVSIRWVGDDAKFAERLGTTSPAFPDLEYTPGEPFGGEEFPVIFGN